MGLFGGSKKTFVSSVPYNLAGEEAQRMNYLKTTIVGGVFTPTGASMGETINGSYLGGPGIKLRNFARWGRTSGYNDAIGMTTSGLVSNPALNYSAIQSQLAAITGQTVSLQTAEIGGADYTYWADQYMFTNYYSQLDTAWKVDFNEATNQIVITLAGGSTVTFTPANFDRKARYLYASYNPIDPGTTGPLVTGSETTLPTGSPFPSTSGYTLTFDDTITPSSTLTTYYHEEISYSDGRPSEVNDYTTSRTESYTAFNRIYERTVYKGAKPGTTSLWSQLEKYVQEQRAVVTSVVTGPVYSETIIAGGVVRGVWTTTTREEYEIARKYRVDTQEIILKTWSRPRVYIYKQGSGNPTLDAMFVTTENSGEFLPFIPFRIDNVFLSPSHLPDIYAKAKKAFKRSMKADYDDVIASITDNPNLSDIDYAYVVFGVALNVKDKDCQRYMYEFFLDNMFGGATGSDYLAWKTQWNIAESSNAAWQAWSSAQSELGNFLFGTPEPTRVAYPTPKDTVVRINSYNQTVMNYDIRISWAGIDEVTGVGLLKADAKTGDMWFTTYPTEDFYQNVLVFNGDAGESWSPYLARSVSHVRLNWQETATSWRYLDIYGLQHENMIYGGKSVTITAAEAIADTDESGFIIPIHERIFKSLPLKVSTQVSTACCFIVFNCYTVVKQKWYQTGIFKVFLVIVIVIVSIFFPPAGAAAGGILGTSSVVGTALGFTGTAALIAGAVANTIAAMILSQLIVTVSTKLLGAKIGAIIGVIASFIAIQAGTAIGAGQSASSVFNDLMRADNLMKLTDVFGKGVAQYLQADAGEYLEKTQKVLEDYRQQSQALTTAFEENIGFGRGLIDPLALTESSGSLLESQETFLQRTLMTGSDIAELSNSMISNFADMTLNQDLMI